MARSLLFALLLGAVEGVTEWLPVSSTGHMILLDAFLDAPFSPAFRELFLVVVQLGAVLAVPTVCFKELNPFSKKKPPVERKAVFSLWGKILAATVPAGAVGFFLGGFLEERLMNPPTVAAALIVYGVAFIVAERRKTAPADIPSASEIPFRTALGIGLFQILSLVPGTSRSGSTVLGGMLLGVPRPVSAEFSFFMAIPVMFGASALKTARFLVSGTALGGEERLALFVGCTAAYLVSVVCIRFLVDFVRRHSFTAFGVYRILLGIAVLFLL